MTLDQKVGQLLFIGISDTQISNRTAKDLRELQPGAIILFKRNILGLRQTARLTSSLKLISKESSSLPLLIATDQEGGRVARVEFTPAMPSPLALGMTKDPKIVEAVSFEAGKFLRYLGFNMNLAPVLDVLSERGSSFIGERSFGSSPKLVSDLGLAFAQGQLRAGIIPTSKHFPGAGLLTKDPHVETVSVDEYSKSLLFPFIQFAQVFPSAVMLSHSSYPKIDPSGVPATFSKKIISNLLIQELGYKGLIITDDLQMGAAKNTARNVGLLSRIGQNAVRSFLAGADLIMITWSPKEQKLAKKALIDAVKSGQISMSDLDARVNKINQIKNLVAPQLRIPSSADNENLFESKGLAVLDDRILNINLSREFRLIEKPSTHERFVVISKLPQFRWSFERALGKSVDSLTNQEFLGLTDSSSEERSFLSRYDCVIFPIYSKKDALFLNSMSRLIRKRTIALNFTSPGLINAAHLRGVLNLFHPHIHAGKFLGELVRGHDEQIENSLNRKL